MSQRTLHGTIVGSLLQEGLNSGSTTSSVDPVSSRKRIRRFHLWLGLIVGVHLLFMGLSGSALVFREEWNSLLEPAVASNAAQAEPQQIAARVSQTLRREFPGLQPRMLVFPKVGRPLRLTLKRPDSGVFQVYFDPAATAVLARGPEVSFPDQVADFHHNLLIGRTGRVINGVIAIILFLLIATGLWLWVMQRRSIALRLTVRWSNSRRGLFDLHTAVGFWLAPFLALIAFSAIYFAWHESVAGFVNAITFSHTVQPPPKAERQRGSATLETITAVAKQAMPKGKISYIVWPARADDPIVVRVKHSDEWRSNGSSHLYLDPSNASVLLSDRTAEQPIGTRIIRNLAPLHFGEFGGRVTQILWVLLGLSPGALFLTGFLIWRRKVL